MPEVIGDTWWSESELKFSSLIRVLSLKLSPGHTRTLGYVECINKIKPLNRIEDQVDTFIELKTR